MIMSRVKMSKYIATLLLVLIAICPSYAQEAHLRDTLQASIKTDHSRRNELRIDRHESVASYIRSVVSPLGEGDPIRWVQSLPGVSSGADGTTSFYVRGGNMGNNLITLDGIPVYGYSHLLGLTTVIPSEIIKSASISKGGFEGGMGNFTASHLAIVTKEVTAKRPQTSFAINNFMASASLESPIGKKMSIQFTGRISPLTLEYKALHKMLPDVLDMDGFRAGVGDAFLKYAWDIGGGRSLKASGLYSMDRYSFHLNDDSNESMGWQNIIGALTYRSEHMAWTDFEAQLSMNSYSSSQRQVKDYRGTVNDLSLVSEMNEAVASAKWTSFIGGRKRLSLGYGLKGRYATFRPGQLATVRNESRTMLASAHLQACYEIPEKLSVKAGVMGNWFMKFDQVPTNQPKPKAFSRIDPDINLSVHFQATKNLAIEATFDRIRQYYHTLEGLPTGWSLDMIVPSGAKVTPETATQGSIGFSYGASSHHASIGGFYRHMEQLVYYKYGQTLFNGGLAVWEDDVNQGKGDSFGIESVYEYSNGDWYGKASYTLSKTTRYGFQDVLDGAEFHARFDRRHVLNATVMWKGASIAFTLQSGNWENAAPEKYPMHTFGEDEWTASYFSGVNNYKMPLVLRLDLGYRHSFITKNIRHELNFGICNVTNHFNPFMLYFDTNTESWKMLALLPILPNFSYRIEF